MDLIQSKDGAYGGAALSAVSADHSDRGESKLPKTLHQSGSFTFYRIDNVEAGGRGAVDAHQKRSLFIHPYIQRFIEGVIAKSDSSIGDRSDDAFAGMFLHVGNIFGVGKWFKRFGKRVGGVLFQ